MCIFGDKTLHLLFYSIAEMFKTTKTGENNEQKIKNNIKLQTNKLLLSEQKTKRNLKIDFCDLLDTLDLL